MSASALHLAELPTETLEQVVLYLPGQDIIRMEAVNRYFQDLIRNSPTLQLRRELFATGLIDNPCNLCHLTQRRKLCEGYAPKWSDAAVIVRSTHKFRPDQSSRWRSIRHYGGNVLVSRSTSGSGLDFLYIPPVASQKPIGMWSIPPFSFPVFVFTVYHPENVLAVGERTVRLLRIHLLNLRDGSPCSAPPSNTITWAIPQGATMIVGGTLAITSSRVMANLSHYGDAARKMLVWDRKTGDLVLNFPTTTWRGLNISDAIFLDEFRIVIRTCNTRTNAPELTVINTLIPQDHPMNSRRFSLLPQYHDRDHLTFSNRDRPLVTLNSGGPLITDPTQAILVVVLSKSGHQNVLLVVRINALIERVCSTHTDVHIPWDEWGRNAVIMEDRRPPGLGLPIYVHGTHLVMVSSIPYRNDLRDCHRVRTFDFGRRRCGALPFWDEEGGGAERKALFLDGNEFEFEVAGVRNMTMLRSLDNGDFFQILDDPSSGLTLHVWELT